MQTYLLKADPEFFSRIDAVAGKGKRAEWIRAACEARLGAGVPVEVSAPKVSAGKAAKRPERKSGVGRWDAQKPVLEAYLRKRPSDARSAARDLGWNEGLVERVALELSGDGVIRFERGLMVHVSG